ncbi:serine/threonine protein kinase [bacterium]|nr:serine/threonine protein kinase [bacterium]
MLATGTLLQERYVVREQVGEGGFGVVYRASDNRLDQDVAIKELTITATPAASHTQALDLFEREAKLLARLNHPTLPRVIDYFSIDQVYYLVMDFIAGTDLWLYTEQHLNNRLPEGEVIQLMLPIIDAVEYLHTQNPPIVHRDIKPSNIIRTHMGSVYLVDFGLAKLDRGQRQQIATAGFVSAGYTAPEQYRQQVDPRADLYAIGATLYALLTGEVPPAATDRAITISTQQPDLLEPINATLLGISPHTADIVARLLNINPDQRYQSATELKAALTSPQSTRRSSGRLAVPTEPAQVGVTQTIQLPNASDGSAQQVAALPASPSHTPSTVPHSVIPVQDNQDLVTVPSVHSTPLTAAEENTLHRIAEQVTISGWLWIVLGSLLTLTICALWFFGPLVGIWNIVAGVMRLNTAKRIRAGDPTIPAQYEGLVGLILTGIINLIIGGVIGVVLVVFDLIIRDRILSNRQLFRR